MIFNFINVGLTKRQFFVGVLLKFEPSPQIRGTRVYRAIVGLVVLLHPPSWKFPFTPLLATISPLSLASRLFHHLSPFIVAYMFYLSTIS